MTTATTIKCDYHESLLDGLRIYHNPHACHPLSPSVFRFQEVYQAYFNERLDRWVVEQETATLMFRHVTTVIGP